MLSQFWVQPRGNDGARRASEYVGMPGMPAGSNGHRPSAPKRDRFEILHSHPLLAPMLVISGVALGNSTFVETPLLADRVYASLSCALVGDNSHQFEDAVDRLTLLLRREQDNRLAALALGKTEPKIFKLRSKTLNVNGKPFSPAPLCVIPLRSRALKIGSENWTSCFVPPCSSKTLSLGP